MVNLPPRAVAGAKHHGSYEWLLQRFTAAIMAIYTLGMISLLMIRQPDGFSEWVAITDNNTWRFGTLLTLLSLFVHAWQGVLDILNDYIKPLALRKAMKLATALALVWYAVWSVLILWKL